MFGLENLDGWKLLVLALLGIFIFGPDRLPKAIADGVRMLRNLRAMARNATSDLGRELGTDLQLEDLHPKALLRKHLLSEEDERALRQPIEDLYHEVRSDVNALRADVAQVKGAATGALKPAVGSTGSPSGSLGSAAAVPPADSGAPAVSDASRPAVRRAVDIDAT